MPLSAIVILLILVAAGGAVVAVIRGLHAFANMQPGEVDENGVPKSLTIQNKMMYSRIKWQGLAIFLVILLLIIGQSK